MRVPSNVDAKAAMWNSRGFRAPRTRYPPSLKGRRDRVFLMTTMGCTLAGGVGAYFFTRKPPPAKAAGSGVFPYAGPIGESIAPSGARAPVLGVALSGVLP